MTCELQVANQAIADRVTAIICAYVSNSPVCALELPPLITSRRASLAGLSARQSWAVGKHDRIATEAQIRKGFTPKALISFVDGEPYKSLRRPLLVDDNTVQSHPALLGLAFDYPMVATSYSERRSKVPRVVKEKKSRPGQWEIVH